MVTATAQAAVRYGVREQSFDISHDGLRACFMTGVSRAIETGRCHSGRDTHDDQATIDAGVDVDGLARHAGREPAVHRKAVRA